MWIAEQLKQLAETYNVILGAEGTEMSLVRQYNITSANKHIFHLDPSIRNCARNENDECALSRVLRSGRAYCSDFDIRSNDISSLVFNAVADAHVAMDASVRVPSRKSSCPRCFYSRMAYELASRVEHADLLARMKMNGSDRDVTLLGIGYSESKDSGRRRACLSLKCTIDGKTKTFLMARINSVPCYLELTSIRGTSSSGYSHCLIDNEAGYQILKDKAQVKPQLIDTLDFRTAGNTVANLYAAHRQQFDMAFRSYFGKLANGGTHRDVILRRHRPKPAEQTRTQASSLDTSILKVAIGVSFVWIAAILVREAQTRRAEKISIL